MREVLTFILAGGRGERLHPLTRDRAKPAVPFGGHYRIIDFALSSCVHSNLRRIFILTQYKSLSLEEHIRDGWTVLSPALDEFLQTIPPQQRTRTDWYLGTADAIHQNLYCIERYAMEHDEPSAVLILAGDHVYKMDYRVMMDFHREKDADVTVAVLRLHRDEVRAKLGELVVDADSRAVAFEEKPLRPTGMPGEPDYCLASLGIYAFRPDVLRDELDRDAGDATSNHDFGRNLLPAMIGRRRVYAFPFELGNRNTGVYWRDVGTLDSYYDAHMDLVGVVPRFDLYDRSWPIHTVNRPKPPAKIVRGDGDATGRGVRLARVVRGHHLRRNRRAVGHLAGRCRAIRRARRGIRPARPCDRRARGAHPPRHPRQARRRARRGDASATTTRPTPSSTP